MISHSAENVVIISIIVCVCPPLPVEHLLGRLWMFPAHLDLQANRKRGKHLSRDPDFTTTRLKSVWVITRSLSTRMRIQICISAGEGSAWFDTHVIFQAGDPRKFLNHLFNPVVGHHLYLRVPSLGIIGKILISLLRTTWQETIGCEIERRRSGSSDGVDKRASRSLGLV